MVGLIWFVQLSHYPLFSRVGTGAFPAYHAGHGPRTALVVGPLMLTELAAAVAILDGLPAAQRPLALSGLVLLGVIWGSTALLQIPAHRRLGHRFDDGAHRRLVATNWIRTLAWSVRGAVALLLL
jgi:hypothetical protein